MKNKVEEKKKYPIYVYYDTSSHGGGICEGDEDSDWPMYETEYTEFRVTDIRLDSGNISCYNRETCEVEWEPKIGDKVFVLVVRYSDGCTFGQSCGYFHIYGVFRTEEELLSYKIALENYTEETKWSDYHRPWVGYFSSLEGWEIYEATLGESFVSDKYDKSTT